MADGVQPAPTNSEISISKLLLGAFFPALLIGLVGMIAFGLFGALFGMINTSASVTIPSFFASFSTMGFFGFVIGFAGYIGYVLEKALVKGT
ncbi:MAG: hypothetical protein QXF80_06870 [Thermoplasmatales archaeon]